VQFLLTIFLLFYPYYYLALSSYSYTCWVPTISVLNLAIFSCYSNLLLRRRRWAGILQQRVLGYMLPRLPFLWSYGVFRYSILLRVIIVFRDITYVINLLYLWHLVICEHFWVVCVEQLILGHAYDEYLVLAQKSGMTLWCFVPLCRSLDLVISLVLRYVVINTGYTIYFTICHFICENWS
jgi:hypothetical protein